jgi:MoaA/NifB/PqqE/SkfB family radical SAM enzyme
MHRYRVTVNLELTGKCNARCVMCPREAIAHPAIMNLETLRAVVTRLDPKDVFRVVVAGYGEPTTHPRFDECLDVLRGAPVRIDMVTNGQLLDEARLARLDGLLHTLIVSYSSIDPGIYAQVHVNLDHARVTRNIVMARQRLRNTRLAISLTPLSVCLPSLPRTIAWLRDQGVAGLTMSPTLYDRAGSMAPSANAAASVDLRRIIRTYGLRSQELDFIPSLRDIYAQWRANRHRCIPRNTDLAIAADGSYQYCFNDIRHSHAIGRVSEITVREALAAREREGADPRLCSDCGVRRRYGPAEVGRVVVAYLRTRNRERADNVISSSLPR